MTGNPDLRSTIQTNVNLTQTIFNKYSITLMFRHSIDPISQISRQDPNNPNILYYQHVNMASSLMYGASIYTPITITPWWTMVVNAMVRNMSGVFENSLNKQEHYRNILFNGSMNNVFKLPAGFQIDLSGYYSSPEKQANMSISGNYSIDLGITKSLFKDKLSLSLSYYGLIRNNQVITIDDPMYNKTNYQFADWSYLRLSLRFNFRGGEKVNIKRATSGNEEQSSRL